MITNLMRSGYGRLNGSLMESINKSYKNLKNIEFYKLIRAHASPFVFPLRKMSTLDTVSPKELEINKMLKQIVSSKYSVHPFSIGLNRLNARQVLERYLAMSEAFPFIQAGAYKNLIDQVIEGKICMSERIEKTFVVGSFLSWDETGGNYLIKTEGMKALPKILDTGDNFHSALLRKDLMNVFSETVRPDYCPSTRVYLTTLGKKLGSNLCFERCAMMVAFEMHAGQMIEALWNALASELKLNKDDLIYFKIHVGGDDPGEVYHIKMVQKLLNSIVLESSDEAKKRFYSSFIHAYQLNIDLCDSICK